MNHVPTKALYCIFHTSKIYYQSQLCCVINRKVHDIISKSLPVSNLNEEASSISPIPESDQVEICPDKSFSFSKYINQNETLQEFVKLGIHLHRLEKKKGVPELFLTLDFQKDVVKYIKFLDDNGVNSEELGNFFSKNPKIFKENTDNLIVRINYLKAKNFTKEQIVRIITRNPPWLNYNVKDIDFKLAFFQKQFKLIGDEVRTLTAKDPRLITYDLWKVETNKFIIKEIMGFGMNETKELLLTTPRLFRNHKDFSLATFEYLHNDMQFNHQEILNFSRLLLFPRRKIKARNEFLVKLKRNEYNPEKPGYINPLDMVSGTDENFCQNIARSSIETYKEFLKTF